MMAIGYSHHMKLITKPAHIEGQAMVAPSGILDGSSVATDNAVVFGQVSGTSFISGGSIIGARSFVHDSRISGKALITQSTFLNVQLNGDLTIQNLTAKDCTFYGTGIWDFEGARIEHLCLWNHIP